MRRSLLALVLAGVTVGAPATQAAPSPQLTDPAADWVVPSQDLLTGRLSSRLVGGKPVLVGELALSQAPLSGAATTYGFYFGVGCQQFGFTYVWAGGTGGSTAEFQRTAFCPSRAAGDAGPDETFPVTFALKGATLTWQTPYVGGIKRGTKVRGFAGAACSGLCGMGTVTSLGTIEVPMGDIGWNDARYVVGSDLPRR